MKLINNKQIQKKLNEQFGIKEIPETLIKFGEEKIFTFSGDLKLLSKLQNITRVEGIGNYIAKEQNEQIRLSIEGTHLFKDQITKNIFELNKQQLKDWMHGSEILLDSKNSEDGRGDLDNQLSNSGRGGWGVAGGIPNVREENKKLKKGFVIMKYKDDFLGTGKASENKITNFIPKIRRLKHAN